MSSLCAPWITGSDILDQRGADIGDTIDEASLDRAAQAASEVLFVLSGKQFTGVCRTTLRPVLRPYGWSTGDWIRYYSAIVGNAYSGMGLGTWGWGTCGDIDSHIGCGRRAIEIGVYPLVAVHSIVENGVTLDPSAYHIESDRWLIRTDGGEWNMHQHVDQQLGSDGTWSIDVSYGDPIPTLAQQAAISFSLELGRAYVGLANGLPQRVTNITRQGVSWTILDPMAFLDNGKTGVYDVDLFLATYNPSGLRRKSRVLSRDTDRQTRRISPITGG